MVAFAINIHLRRSILFLSELFLLLFLNFSEEETLEQGGGAADGLGLESNPGICIWPPVQPLSENNAPVEEKKSVLSIDLCCN